MYIGIKYELRKKIVNNQLQNLGSAIMFQGQTSYYFTNPIVALSVKQYLNRKMRNYKYELQHLSKEDIKNKTLIKTYEDFTTLTQPKNVQKSRCNDLEKEQMEK